MRIKIWAASTLLLFQHVFHGTGFEGVGGGRLVRPKGLWRPSLLLPDRDIKVWLPPGYDDVSNSKIRYETLYVHDGQNAMEDSTSWTG